jgi:hypothetical protein
MLWRKRAKKRRTKPKLGTFEKMSREIAVETAMEKLPLLLEQHECTRGLLLNKRGETIKLYREEELKGGQGSDRRDCVRLCLVDAKAGIFELSVKRHTGRWEPTPFRGTVEDLVQVILTTMQHLVASWP